MTAIPDPATTVRGCEPTTPTLAGGRERIIQAASALFTRYGTRTVGVDTVVARARVAKMTLYRHFASKDELILVRIQICLLVRVSLVCYVGNSIFGWLRREVGGHGTAHEARRVGCGGFGLAQLEATSP
jgi:Bacterial regulatory proteins, tetR family